MVLIGSAPHDVATIIDVVHPDVIASGYRRLSSRFPCEMTTFARPPLYIMTQYLGSR